jgi:hypothetical protein
MEKIVVITNSLADDLIGLRMLLKELVKRKVEEKNIFILSTTLKLDARDASDTCKVSDILNEIIKPIYPNLSCNISCQPPQSSLGEREGKEEEYENQDKCSIDKMCQFILSSKKDESVDILLLAPATNFSSCVTDQLAASQKQKVRSIWSWGGLSSSAASASTIKETVDSKTLASDNWKNGTNEMIHLLNWTQQNNIPFFICTPAIYQTTLPLFNLSKSYKSPTLNEENCPIFIKILEENKELNLITTSIKLQNMTTSSIVGAITLQFTPASSLAVATYLWPNEMVTNYADNCEKIFVDENGFVTRLATLAEDKDGKEVEEESLSISFINEINYNFFVDRLCEL